MSPAALMDRAVALAGRGFPAPNPRVGCVIASGGEIVGEGWHARAGGPHAEVVALEGAGERARGATAYVTLEPCDHTGRTGPCSLALIAAGVARVRYAVADPNPLAGGGAARLVAAGIECDAGLGAEAAEAGNRAWLAAMRRGSPFVTLKAAVSLDGRIALPDGRSRWITGEAAQADAHRLRAERGAVLVGRRTVESDDPALTVRLGAEATGEAPWRVVLDPSDRLGPGRRVFDEAAPSVRYVGRPSRPHDRPWTGDLAELLRDLFAAGRTGLLVEGGAATHAGFLRGGFADEIVLYVAPKLLGEGLSWVEGTFADPLGSSASFRFVEAEPVGEDVRLTYRSGGA